MHPVLIVALLGGCKKVEPAPADLDGLVHFFWESYDTDDPAVLREALANLHGAVDGDALGDPVDGALTGIDQAHLDVVGRTGVDPKAAAGWYMARSFTCAMPRLEQILTSTDQATQYPDVYESYTRTIDGDRAAFLAGDPDDLSWEVDIVGDYWPLGHYEEHLQGGVRRVDPLDADDPFDTLLVTRTWIPQPVVFDGDGKTWEQDYQIEMFWPRGPEVLHVYGVWRQMDVGPSMDSDSEGFVRVTLNNMAEWDDQTEVLCAEDGT